MLSSFGSHCKIWFLEVVVVIKILCTKSRYFTWVYYFYMCALKYIQWKKTQYMQNVHKTQVSMSKVRLSLYDHEETIESKEKLSTLTTRHKRLASFVSTVRMKFFATTSYMSHVNSYSIWSYKMYTIWYTQRHNSCHTSVVHINKPAAL